MNHYRINVAQVEELQMINNRVELERIFTKARSALVNGALVVLYRKWGAEAEAPFDQISTEADLSVYKEGVFKYLSL